MDNGRYFFKKLDLTSANLIKTHATASNVKQRKQTSEWKYYLANKLDQLMANNNASFIYFGHILYTKSYRIFLNKAHEPWELALLLFAKAL